MLQKLILTFCITLFASYNTMASNDELDELKLENNSTTLWGLPSEELLDSAIKDKDYKRVTNIHIILANKKLNEIQIKRIIEFSFGLCIINAKALTREFNFDQSVYENYGKKLLDITASVRKQILKHAIKIDEK